MTTLPDNVLITAGTGTTIAADDISGVKYQRVKPAWGVDGAAVDVSAADPMPVTNAAIGAPADAAASSDTGTFSLISLFKRLLGKFLVGSQTHAASLATTNASATLYAGTLTTSTTAAALASTQAVREVLVQNDPDNSADVLIGNSSAQPIQLKPGQSIVIPVADLATVYAKSGSGAPVVNYLGRS